MLCEVCGARACVCGARCVRAHVCVWRDMLRWWWWWCARMRCVLVVACDVCGVCEVYVACEMCAARAAQQVESCVAHWDVSSEIGGERPFHRGLISDEAKAARTSGQVSAESSILDACLSVQLFCCARDDSPGTGPFVDSLPARALATNARNSGGSGGPGRGSPYSTGTPIRADGQQCGSFIWPDCSHHFEAACF